MTDSIHAVLDVIVELVLALVVGVVSWLFWMIKRSVNRVTNQLDKNSAAIFGTENNVGVAGELKILAEQHDEICKDVDLLNQKVAVLQEKIVENQEKITKELADSKLETEKGFTEVHKQLGEIIGLLKRGEQ